MLKPEAAAAVQAVEIVRNAALPATERERRYDSKLCETHLRLFKKTVKRDNRKPAKLRAGEGTYQRKKKPREFEASEMNHDK